MKQCEASLAAMKMIPKLQPLVFLIIISTCFVSVTAQINLALHGTVNQSTTYTGADGTSYGANLAIEGPANNNWADGCSSTSANQKTAWWGLHLPKLAYISNVKSYYRKETPHRMNDFRLYFSNGTVYSRQMELCYRDTSQQAYLTLNQSIDCDLSPTKNVFYFNRYTFIELCYIEISGCWKGFWGENCSVPCPSNCIGQHCYPANGSCVWGCDPTNCGQSCFFRTGVCLGGCELGRAGQYCNKYNLAYNKTAQIVPVGQTTASFLVDGLISTCGSFTSTANRSYLQVEFGSLSVITTVHFVFGDKTTANDGHAVYCSNTTDMWNDGHLLYSGLRLDTDITTFAVCKYLIYVPPTLRGNNMVELCEIEIGGCPYRRYGDNCEHACPENCLGHGQCGLISGNCLSVCSDGWIGEQCDQACGEDKFGGQCLRDCSVNCLSSPCDHVTGQCKSGCLKGWEGLNCTEECSKGNFGWNCNATCDGCIGNECNHINGVCKIDSVCKPGFVYGKYCNEKCEAWLFGTNCNQMCNCLENPCSIFTGECSDDGCKKGWKGDSCDQECAYGYFGFNCAYLCETCFNQSCDIFEGNCRVGCNDGYRGRKCEMPVSSESSAIIRFGFFIGGIASMCIVLLIIWMVKNARRQIIKKQENRQATDNIHSNGNEQHYDDIMKMEGLSTYQDLAKQTVTVSNDYDQINNAYANQ